MPLENQPEPTASPGSLLADEMYPEPAAPEPPPEPAPEPPPDIPGDATGDPPGDEVPPEGAEPSGEPEPKGVPPEDPDGVEVKSFEELAEHFELDSEWLETLTIAQKVNGEMIDVPLADALSTHRQVTAADTYLAEAKQEAKSIKAEASQQKELLAGSVATFAAMINAQEAADEAEAKSINWQELRTQDPAEYNAKKLDFREKAESRAQLRTDAVTAYNNAVNMLEQAQTQTMIDNLPQEHEVFNERIPEWADEKFAKKERTELVKYLSADGFTPQDVKAASFNGKVLAIAVKAKRYDEIKGKSNAAKKKVVKIPKVLQPGSHEASITPAAAKSDDPVVILYGPS